MLTKTKFTKNCFEIDAWKTSHCVVGIDEVGRGCLSGPLVVAADGLVGVQTDDHNVPLAATEVKILDVPRMQHIEAPVGKDDPPPPAAHRFHFDQQLLDGSQFGDVHR